jgi:hypothetical protein
MMSCTVFAVDAEDREHAFFPFFLGLGIGLVLGVVLGIGGLFLFATFSSDYVEEQDEEMRHR